MDTHEQKVSSWIERVEDLINLLEGSTVSELELTEAGTEIIIRRQPGMMMVPPFGRDSTARCGRLGMSDASASINWLPTTSSCAGASRIFASRCGRSGVESPFCARVPYTFQIREAL